MLRIVATEHEHIPRSKYPSHVLERIQRFDELHGRRTGTTVFDWSRRDSFRAKSSVGVLEIPGVCIEILPKIDRDLAQGASAEQEGVRRRNLLFMLSYALEIDFSERDLARLTAESAPLIEPMAAAFASRLLRELQRGLVHEYVGQEENVTALKGRLLIVQDLRANAANRARFYVHKEEFVSDGLLNRILKATARRLRIESRDLAVRRRLDDSLTLMEQVHDHRLVRSDFRKVTLGRQNTRFRPLLDFCQLLFDARSPTLSSGDSRSFALLFPMEVVFEEFVARFLQRHAIDLGISREQLIFQGRGVRRPLVYDEKNRGHFWLLPDVMVLGEDQRPNIIIDTKWKLLDGRASERKSVSQADAYQLFAYAMRYQSRDNVLLYPKWASEQRRSWTTDAGKTTTRIRVECLDLSFDLRTNRDRLCTDLRNILFRAPSG